MSREVGYYSVKRFKHSYETIAFWNGLDFFCVGETTFHPESDFLWISDKRIEPEKMPMILEDGKYYVYCSLYGGVKTIGKYMRDIDSFRGKPTCYSSEANVLAGPFDLDELIDMKPL